MNIITLILNWFKKDHAKASAKIKSSFSSISAELQKVNQSAAKQAADNQQKIAQLSEENKGLGETINSNAKVVANIEKILGND